VSPVFDADNNNGNPVPSHSGSWVSSFDTSVTSLDSATLSDAFNPTSHSNFSADRDILLANTPIPDVSVRSGSKLSFQLASDTFSSIEGTSSIALSATQADGRPLPGWLKFDPRTGRFEGTPPIAFEGTLSFKVVAKDAHGRVAVQVFKIVVSKDGQSGRSADAGHGIAETVGRTSLGEQLQVARSAGADRLAILSHSAATGRPRA
jgi:hypothetical protein